MRVAIDGRGINLYKGTGIGTYTENILKNMLSLDVSKNNFYEIYWTGNNYEEFQKENSRIVMSSKRHHRFFEQYYFPQSINNSEIELFHMPQNGIGISEYVTCKKVVTIHDLIPYIMPETVGKGYLIKFLKEIPKAIELSDTIITVSQCSKRDIQKFFPIESKKIFVTPLAADKKYMPMDREKCQYELEKKYGISKPFILYIGGFSPRKNVKALITAFSKIFTRLRKEYSLVIVGANKDDGNVLASLSNNLNISSNILFTGFVDENDLPIFYNGCDVFVYPSLYEGFGLPPLEAMNCGTPVITSNISSIPEVVGNCGVLIDPYSEKELMESLEKVLNDNNFKNEISLKGLQRASEFSWEKTAEETIKAYEAASGNSKQ